MLFVGFNPASLVAIIDLLLAIAILVGYGVLSGQAFRAPGGAVAGTIYLLQAVMVPVSLAIAALILFFQGWRLDPLLLTAVGLLHVGLIASCVKDFILRSHR